MSIFDYIFIFISLLLCYTRYKKYCTSCDGNKWGDIFQIFFTSVAVVLFVGTLPILKLLGIMVFSYIFRQTIATIFSKTAKKKEDCGTCNDPWT